MIIATSPLFLSAATYRNYISHEVINSGNTLRVWIDSDTAFGEFASAEIRWDNGMGGFNFSGVIDGSFDDMTEPGANWFVDIALPGGVGEADLQLANKNESGSYYGFTGFIHALSALPVEFEKVSAESTAGEITLHFSTYTETNNSHFDIERSTNSRQWETLGRIIGAGTTQERQSYTFEDKAPLAGDNFYRIKQVDYDGTFSYSDIVSARWTEKPQLSIYPNPASEFLLIRGIRGIENTVTVEVFNLNGQLLISKTWNQQPVHIAFLPKGSYAIRIRSGQDILQQERVIIQ